MFTGSRQMVLDALDVFGHRACIYGTWPDGTCDCKYGVGEGGSEQSGCPELRTLRQLVTALTDDEWALLERRAGGTPSGLFVASPNDIRARLHRADAAALMASENIAIVRNLLSLEPSIKESS